jgi:hypothetical protein
MADSLIEIDPAYLASLVQVASHNPRLVITDWQVQRLYGGFQLNSSVYRVQGQARDAGPPQPWPLVLKVVRPDPEYPNPLDYRYWKRPRRNHPQPAGPRTAGLPSSHPR